VSFVRELVRWGAPTRAGELTRAYNPAWEQYVNWRDSLFTFQGAQYGGGYATTMPGSKVEPPSDTFAGYVQACYKANGIIFAVSMARARPFSEVRFKFRRRNTSGGGNDLFGKPALEVLERPWPGGTTQQLMLRAEQDVTAAGTFFLARSIDGTRLLRRRPDWTEFILDAAPDQATEANIVGYKYTAGGPGRGGPSMLYTLDDCVHWAPIPDPEAEYRGMSWITPVIKEFLADQASTQHKLQFFENAATPNLAVSLKETVTPAQFQEFVTAAKQATAGIGNAYKTMYLGGGADVTPIGTDLRQLDFAVTQGHGETRVAAAGGVPPIVVGLSEGLQAATYSNYGQAKRAYGDLFLRSQWRSFVGAVAPLVDVPADAELWYDASDVAFLREDSMDLAQTMSTTAATINALIAGGFEPASAVTAVLAEDLSQLKHTGMLSVQLQPPPDPNAPAPGAVDPNAIDPNAPDPAADAGAAAALDQIGA
jgi:phage portal protein BeeE